MRSFLVIGLDDERLRLQAAQAGLALRPDELRRIAAALGRDPTTVEIHAFDAQWSEHCSYKSSRAHLAKLPKNGPAVVLGPGEDAGILHVGEWDGRRYAVVVAHESHNHPSQVVPFEGAATGVGGIVRDVLCMGAEVIAVADALRFGRVERPDAHPRHVARGVVAGIGAYGNAIGVPNLAGDAYFDAGFDDNCLVNVIALGLVDEAAIIHSRVPEGGDGYDLVLVGKATDASGFGGASFSSATLDVADREADKAAVQVPDPFLKNVLMRATYRAFALIRERGLAVGFKDLGAGGIMGCSAELCAAGGFGAVIELDRVNVAVAGLPPEVIAVGETQERMLWAVPPAFTPELLRLYNDEFTLPEIAYEARAVVIGRVTRERRYVMRHRGANVMDVPIDVLTGSLRDDHEHRPLTTSAAVVREPVLVPVPESLQGLLERVLSHRDVCSREPLFRSYDAVVRGRTVIPRGDADAGVLAPIFGAPFGIALAVAGNPRYGRIDPRACAEHAVHEAVRCVVAVGARPLGLTDCLNFGDPGRVEHHSAFVAAVEGLADAARACGLPFVSGNVSLHNTSSSGGAVPPSPIVACVGVVDDVMRVPSAALTRAGSVLYRVGAPQRALGGSVLHDVLQLAPEGLPSVDHAACARANAFVATAVREGSVSAVRVIGSGGMLVALCRMAFGSGVAPHHRLGVRLTDGATDARLGTLESLFGEAPGFVVEVPAERAAAFEGAARSQGLSLASIGTVTADPTLDLGSERIPVEVLYRCWSAPLEEVFA